MIRAGLALAATLALSLPAFSQELLSRPSLSPGVAALPRLAGQDHLSQSVNAELDRLDATDLDAVNCYGGSRSDGPFRSVEILSDGPEFLSFFIMTGTFCEGAAHPWSLQRIVNFDLETGLQTDLRDMGPDTFLSADDQGELLTVLFLTHVADLTGECAAAYAYAWREGYLGLDLGIAEAKGALMLWPDGLSYADAPCLDVAYVPAERLREAGFDARLIKALTP